MNIYINYFPIASWHKGIFFCMRIHSIHPSVGEKCILTYAHKKFDLNFWIVFKISVHSGTSIVNYHP